MKKARFGLRSVGAASAVLLVVFVSGCGTVGDDPDASASAPQGAVGGRYLAGEAVKAMAQLETLPVKGLGPRTGYSRDEFGPAWADTDHNGCDTRNDILARDLTNETFKSGTNNCVVTTGTLADKYTGTTINFVRGQNTSAAVHIDHIVALGDAWQKGGQQLSTDQREELANDPLNLMAVGGHTNSAKGDKDAAAWLPPNTAFRCDYVSKQVVIKAKYSLWVSQAEHEAILDILEGCKCTAVDSGVRPQLGRGPAASVFWDPDTPFSLPTIVGAREDH
ncbi:HNH endonuclease [Arthrobacter nitrophenolicus]|uniref:HNH endonuclease n=1 Tax=Arthrobacter nitrophenolicus TaxID=683150 RepID=A0A4R5XR71_9MICC|nr:HNH endonuclease family protein [Arthrobacter nitrophenolicus]TDL34064.1 HNH endonuclease [Arthrobacter nitrophenolicus]